MYGQPRVLCGISSNQRLLRPRPLLHRVFLVSITTFSVSHGYFVNLLRVRRSGTLSRHRHTGTVQATTIRGRWHYLEHSWWATEGSHAFEPPGDIPTLEMPEGVEEMITLFHVTGAYIHVDVDGNPDGVEDVFSKLQSARDHYEKVGLGKDYANQFIR